MGCGCSGGIAKFVNGRVASTPSLPRTIVLVRYLGDVENGELTLTKGGTRHQYGAARRLFYVDEKEVSRILAWGRNGTREFETVI